VSVLLQTRWRPLSIAVAALLLFAVPLAAAVPVPPLQARVTDLTGTLRAAERQALESKLEAFEQRKGSQIAVLIVPTTRPEEIEQFGIRVVEKWKLGRKGVDDGALLLVAKNDRAVRIEVGYGLEGSLTDATCNRIIEETIVPRFRAGRFFEGIDAGVSQMIAVVGGEPLPPPRGRAGRPPRIDGIDQIAFFVLIAVVFVLQALRFLLGRLQAAAVGGGLAGFFLWLWLSSLGIAAIAAVIVFLLLLLGGSPHARRHRYGAWSGYDGWSGGGGGGGFGGGFSGGGGGFGGGGASGRW